MPKSRDEQRAVNRCMKARIPSDLRVLLPLMVLMLGGCSLIATNQSEMKEPLLTENLLQGVREQKAARGDSAQSTRLESVDEPQQTGFYVTTKPPQPNRTSAGSAPPPLPPPLDPKDQVSSSVALENMPLPQFINAIYAVVLKRNVSVDPAVLKRTDLVSLRTGKPQTAEQLASTAQAVLRSYGIAVNEFQGLVRVVPETGQSGYLPEIRRGRAQPDVPAGLRPVFFLVELEHTNVANATNWLRTLFPGRLTLTDDPARNAILISGQSDIVSAAMEALQLLDQPLLRGRLSVRITPVFWSADEMAKRLVDVLAAEGYAAAVNPGANTPILVMPVGPVNSVIVFATNEQVLNHILRWARDLDQTPQGRNGGFITYYVRNTDASDLAKTLQEVMGGAASAATGTTAAAGSATGGKKVVVNTAANSLIIRATPSEYQQWYGLLQELDRPARAALIMATVAEVRLTDSEQFGFNWLLKQFVSNGMRVNAGVGIGKSPSVGTFYLNFASMSGDPRALLTALASSNRIRILSNPSVVALNGQSATIQVGQEVPILTSQVTNANTSTSTGQGTLQTIQYRNTGVILKVKPVIHSGGRIDLEVSQEVSAAQKNETGVESSPIILTRRVETKLSLSDGNTTLLGGLISENRTSGDAGLPYLKDIPVAGALFRTTSSLSTERTELVVLLTPYVIGDDFDAAAVTEAFRSQFAWATTLPPATGSGMNKKAIDPVSVGTAQPSPATPDAGQTEPRAADEKGVGQQPVVTPLPPAKMPPAGQKAPPKGQPKSYVVPDADEPALVLSRSVAPMQQPTRPLLPAASTGPASGGGAAVPVEARGQAARTQGAPVMDEALKQELLKTIQGGR